MQQIQWVWEQMKGFQRRYIFALVTTILLQIMLLINPILSQKIVDEVVYKLPKGGEVPPELVHTLIVLILCMIVFTLVRTGLRYWNTIIYEDCGQKFLYQVKNELYDKLQNQDSSFYSEHRTGDLMTRLTGDLEMGKHGIAFISKGLLECVFLFAATSIYMLSKDVLFACSLLLITPFIFLVTRKFSKIVGPYYVDLRERLSLLNSNAQENIAGNRVVRAFAQEEYEIKKFDEKNAEYRAANLKATMTWLRFFPAIEGLSQALSIAVLVIGGLFMMNGRISAGTFMAFNSLCWTLAAPMRMLGMLLNDLQRFFASMNKVIELYYEQPRIKTPKHPEEIKDRLQGNIRFQDVCVSLHHHEVLHNINLDIRAGETVVIMGSTGSGKSTLINCINRFVDISGGSLTIDGVEVRRYRLEQLRHNIGLASQEVFLFSDTIDGNIAYGDLSLSEDEVKHFAKLASADFIEKTSEGFETIIGERGAGLSGGQKQRIALARALAVRPPILILDDTTSAVDLETEKHIQNSLRQLDFPCTKILIAQRVSTAKYADKIVVLDQGRIIEQGTHDQLLRHQGYYYEMYCLQNGIPLSKEVG